MQKLIIFITAIITLINFYLAISFLIKRKRKAFDYLSLILVLIFLSIWSFGILGFHFFEIIEKSLWIKITHLFGMLVSYAFLCFVFFYPQRIFKNKFLVLLSIPCLIIIWYVLFSDKIIGKAYDKSYEIGELYLLYTLIIIIYFLIAFIGLSFQFKATNDKKVKFQILMIFIGSLLSSLVILFFDLILPYYSIFTYTWIGPLFLIIWILFLGIAITKFALFDFKVIISEILLFTLWSILIINLILTTNILNFAINLILFILLLIIGMLLINSVIKEFEQKEKLEELNKRLEYQYNLRGKILSIISHQVRSPLVNIKEFVRFLIEGNYGQLPEKAKEILKRIDKNIKEGINLTNDLGDFRKMEENKFDYHFDYFNLTEVIQDIYELYKNFAQEKKLELKCNIFSDHLNIKGDKEKLRQALVNLVENAIKYTEQGYIEINVQKNENEILITVMDTGKGIKKEYLESIFNEFTNLDINKKTILGTGLGLYISQKIIEAHNGKIWAESEGEGKGSKFYIKLPFTIEKNHQLGSY